MKLTVLFFPNGMCLSQHISECLIYKIQIYFLLSRSCWIHSLSSLLPYLLLMYIDRHYPLQCWAQFLFFLTWLWLWGEEHRDVVQQYRVLSARWQALIKVKRGQLLQVSIFVPSQDLPVRRGFHNFWTSITLTVTIDR
jgi:hypothetical protein